jgi:hypothetical protein
MRSTALWLKRAVTWIGFALRKRQSGNPTKRAAPWRVDVPPPSVPTTSPAPTKAPASRNRLTHNDFLVNAAYHQVMSSANTEPYAVPTSQRPPPPQQQAIRQARVSLDYRRADQPPLMLIEDPPPMEESSSASPPPNPDLPADHWRNGGRGKGKRPPPQSASRQPLKYARGDDWTYPSSRSAQSSEPLIPLPPNAKDAPEPALTAKTSSRPRLTPGEAGVPLYKGDEYQPLTRKECKSYYSIRQPKQPSRQGWRTDIR